MSYGAANQLLKAGLMTTADIMAHAKDWPDRIQFLHTQIACKAWEYVEANCAYMEAQSTAAALGTTAAQARIYLHNAVAEWQNALEAFNKTNETSQSADAVDPNAADPGTPSTRVK